MNDLEEQIVRHVGRYGISTKAVIERLFHGARPLTAVNRLVMDGCLAEHPGKNGIPTYYQISLKEAVRLGFPKDRARTDKSEKLFVYTSILWFCCMTTHERKLLEREELRQILPLVGGSGFGMMHAAHKGDDAQSTIYRLYVVQQQVRNEDFAKLIRKDAKAVRKFPALAEWADNGTYQFAILLNDANRIRRLRDLIYKAPLPQVGIQFEVVPSLYQLAQGEASL